MRAPRSPTILPNQAEAAPGPWQLGTGEVAAMELFEDALEGIQEPRHKQPFDRDVASTASKNSIGFVESWALERMTQPEMRSIYAPKSLNKPLTAPKTRIYAPKIDHFPLCAHVPSMYMRSKPPFPPHPSGAFFKTFHIYIEFRRPPADRQLGLTGEPLRPRKRLRAVYIEKD